MERKKVTVPDILRMKNEGKKITKINLHDYPTAVLADRAGIDMVMVGDSVGMVALGYENTLPVTLEEMIHHCKAVARGAKRCLVVGDMPFLSYQVSREDALRNAGRLFKETGIDAVKLEGGAEIVGTVRAIVGAGIPVMGHLGLMPQRISQIGGYRVQGKDAASARAILKDALELERAGVFCLVLESVTAEAAGMIAGRLRVPALGAGSGPFVDGQSLNLYDLLGLSLGVVPRFAKRYLNLSEEIVRVLTEFRGDVDSRKFPGEENFFRMGPGEKMKIAPAKRKKSRA